MSPEERIQKLEDLLRPFADAYRLHLRDDKRVTQLKIAMSMNTSVEDWRAAFVELYGEPVVKTEEVV
ncbi:MAG: hypothetical protein J0M11_03650 [Anaerolineae bacterium]|nr:hypothetical protein [Anaerolineae bacterium]